MVSFFSRAVGPRPDDLCLVHSPMPNPLFRPAAGGWWAPRADLPFEIPGLFLGEAGGRPLWSLEVPVPRGETWEGLRAVLSAADADQGKAVIRAAELAAWVRDHRFCGQCGTPTERRPDQVAFDCPQCGAEFWPRVTPAVIMLVHRGDEVLLAQNARFRGTGISSCLAGFVETSETLEEAVVREVFEEVGVVVGQPVYQGSQPWPFPHALMLGFHVPWVSGEPVPDGAEIIHADWYRRDTLPPLPSPISLARRLIRGYFRDLTL